MTPYIDALVAFACGVIIVFTSLFVLSAVALGALRERQRGNRRRHTLGRYLRVNGRIQ